MSGVQLKFGDVLKRIEPGHATGVVCRVKGERCTILGLMNGKLIHGQQSVLLQSWRPIGETLAHHQRWRLPLLKEELEYRIDTVIGQPKNAAQFRRIRQTEKSARMAALLLGVTPAERKREEIPENYIPVSEFYKQCSELGSPMKGLVSKYWFAKGRVKGDKAEPLNLSALFAEREFTADLHKTFPAWKFLQAVISQGAGGALSAAVLSERF